MSAGKSAPRYQLRVAEQLEPDQRVLHEKITQGPRASQKSTIPLVNEQGALLGPFGLMTLAPQVGDAVQNVGAALRFSTGLSDLIREAAILLVGTFHECEFEWLAHKTAALNAGITQAQLVQLAQGQVPEGLAEDARLALETVKSLLNNRGLSDAHYGQAIEHLGERTLAELVWLCGYYSQLALAMAVFQPPLPSR